MWDLPGPGLEPVSPASAGGFLTTAPPGKPDTLFIALLCHLLLSAISAERIKGKITVFLIYINIYYMLCGIIYI